MSTIARWCLSHRRYVLAGWVVALLVMGGIAHGVGSAYSNNFTLPGTDTQRALDLLKAEFPAQSGDVDSIVLHSRTGSVEDPTVRTAATAMLAKVSRLPHVRAVLSPYSSGNSAQISKNRTIAYASVIFDGSAIQVPQGAVKSVINTAEAVSTLR